jgi:hypothetical protein
MQDVLQHDGIVEAFALHTCMMHLSSDAVDRLQLISPAPSEIYVAERCIVHAIRVASGMDAVLSMDNHVKNQCTVAFDKTYTCHRKIGRILPRLWDTVLRESKRERRLRPSSDCDLMFKWVQDHVNTERVVVVGAGAVGQSCAWYLQRKHQVTVINRTPKTILGTTAQPLSSIAKLVDENVTIVHCADVSLDLHGVVFARIVDLTAPARTTNMVGGLVVRLADQDTQYSQYGNREDQEQQEQQRHYEVATEFLKGLEIDRVLAHTCLPLNRRLKKLPRGAERQKILQDRHRIVLAVYKEFGVSYHNRNRQRRPR